MRKNSIKNTRINGEVQKALSDIIRSELKDPRIHPMTSVVLVQVTPDLKILQGVYQRSCRRGAGQGHHPRLKERRGLYPDPAGKGGEP